MTIGSGNGQLDMDIHVRIEPVGNLDGEWYVNIDQASVARRYS